MLRTGWGGGLVAAVVLSCLVFAGAASAQGTAGSDAEAHALFVAGQVAYDEGRYESALQDFQRAYDLSGRAELLFNIGAAAEHVRHDADALAAYERYLAERPDAANRSVVEARVAVLRQAIAEHTQATVTTEATLPEETSPPPPPPAASSGPGPVPWIVLGVGGAVAIAGAVLVALGYAAIDRVQSARDTYWTDVSGAYADGPVLTGVGFAMLGVGVAAIVGGLVWALVGGGGSSGTTSRGPHLGGWAGANGCGLSLEGAF